MDNQGFTGPQPQFTNTYVCEVNLYVCEVGEARLFYVQYHKKIAPGMNVQYCVNNNYRYC